MKKIVIIPAYNEISNIRTTVQDILDHAPGFDYVIINDCSQDGTMRFCTEQGMNIINLPVNLGIGGAVQTGYLYAWRNGYDVAVQFDGDGQHDASYLGEMADFLQAQQADMVIGSRYIKKEGFQSSGIRQFGIRYFSALIKLLTGKRVTDPTSGMRMVNRDVMKIYSEDYPVDYPEPESVVTILRMGKKVSEIPVIMRERQGGVSSISPRKAVYYMIKVTLAILMECLRKRRK
ncbi:glycosyltransferase family 2 protein [Oscillospiraceae bacterium Marseille-Q3528]|nr:glycosyltransferase family 2 protein [Oscillospiraceae bacterium Marseille-Q3528]